MTEANRNIQLDIAIVGGGIAGLWLLNRLKREGYDCALFENKALGSDQSVGSQGMIHGGIKYALAGSLNAASQAIADMPAHWEACLKGEGSVDLRGTRVLSRHYYMWPRSSMRSRFNAFLGSKALRGKVSTVNPSNYPDFFRDRIQGPLYELKDIVLDVPSLLHCLSTRYQQDIKLFDPARLQCMTDTDGGIPELHYHHAGEDYILRAKRYLICSGEGSAGLLQKIFPDNRLPGQLQMQLRPLQMSIVKHDFPEPVYVHCVADQLTATPELTITTHPCRDGKFAWYLGGELAESGVKRSPAEQNQTALARLRELFPWLDFSTATCESFFINRAEALTPNGKRPESASIHAHKNLLLCWPSKLTLSPNLGQQVIERFQQDEIKAGSADQSDLTHWPFPGIAQAPWERLS